MMNWFAERPLIARPKIAAGSPWSSFSNQNQIVIDNGIMYSNSANWMDRIGSGNISKISMADGSVIASPWVTIPNADALGQMVISNGYLYVPVFIQAGGLDPNALYLSSFTGFNIVKVRLSDGTIEELWCVGLRGPYGLTIVGDYMYATTYAIDGSSGNDSIAKIDMYNGAIVNLNWCSGILSNSLPSTLAHSGDYLYTPYDRQIAKISLADGSKNAYWFNGNIYTPYIAIYGNYVYAQNDNWYDSIAKINLVDGSIVDYQYYTGVYLPTGMAFSNNQLYISSVTDGIYKFPLPVICFHENTKILTEKGYRVIKDLRKGDLIQTSLHGFKPIESIGHSKIYNPENQLRSQNRLYKCSQNNYPEITEDLIITGCHSILVDDLSNKQKEETIEMLGELKVTDRKYRLMACLDDRSLPYEVEGIHNIWHFALEHDNYYMNYGIYANGLLVETTSKRMMHELSGMELV
jgi:hypothetical protein